MSDNDTNKIVQKSRRDNISFQVISEDIHRFDLNRLKQFEDWLKLEGVDEEILTHFLEWANSLIEDNLKRKMNVKKLMQRGIDNAVEINLLRFGDNLTE